MNTAQREHHWKQLAKCAKKRSFSKQRDAKRWATTIHRRTGVTQTIYQCPHCGKFHAATYRG